MLSDGELLPPRSDVASFAGSITLKGGWGLFATKASHPSVVQALESSHPAVMAPADQLATIDAIESIECGNDAAQHFGFAPGYLNLNHGGHGVSDPHPTSLM